MAKKPQLPRVPLPRQTGGAHRVTREESIANLFGGRKPLVPLKGFRKPRHVRHQGTRERTRRVEQTLSGKLTGGASNPHFVSAIWEEAAKRWSA